jgi:protein-tyrosine kinase
MVERLKQAIEKARIAREAGHERNIARSGGAHGVGAPTETWKTLSEEQVDVARLERQRIVSLTRSHSAHTAFDRLRTRVLRLCAENGWSQIAITSPTSGCGKSFVALNLAFSLARKFDSHGLLVELDMRAPSYQQILGITPKASISDLLTGTASARDVFFRVGETLAIGLSKSRVPNSSELLLSPNALRNLEKARTELHPEITVYDLPPLLGCDDALAFSPSVDAVLLVAAAGRTTSDELDECDRLLANAAPIIGVVLNKVESSEADDYAGSYAHAAVSS